MKKLSLFALAAAGLLLGACSDKDDVVQSTANLDTNGSSFVGVAIQMPSATSTTRANDDLNNGIEDEFTVHDGYLLLFKGTDAETATFINSYSLMKLAADGSFEDFEADTEGAGVTNDNSTNPDPQTAVMEGTKITSTGVVVAKIEDLTLLPTEDLYAFVVLNPNINAQYVPENGQSFADWSQKAFEVGDLSDASANSMGATLEGVISDNGMTMTNSPVSDVAGGSNNPSSANITSAYRLDKSKIAKTADAAKNAPAGCIFVERVAAKVTVAEGNDLGETLGETGNQIKFEIDGWQVINVEPTYYNIRQANEPTWLPYKSEYATTYGKTKNANTEYRFVTKYDFAPTLPTETGHTDDGVRYRTYFGFDPQYAVAAALNKTVASTAAADEGKWLGLDGVSYVPENTFDVANQVWKNTTQVTLRVKFNEGKDLYTINEDPTYYQATAIENAIAATVDKVYEINKFKNDIVADVLAQLKDDVNYYKATASISVEIAETDEVASNSVPYTVTYKVTAQKSTDNTTFTDIMDDTDPTKVKEFTPSATYAGQDFDAAVIAAKKRVVVALYKGGMSYYNVRIQHFGQAETPWDDIPETVALADANPSKFKVQPGATVADIYGYRTGEEEIANARFLGRYGVVRDNWYVLTVDKIGKLGSAVPEDVSDNETPDDIIEQEYYISAHVHILPWVLRNQSVKF